MLTDVEHTFVIFTPAPLVTTRLPAAAATGEPTGPEQLHQVQTLGSHVEAVSRPSSNAAIRLGVGARGTPS